MCFPNWIIGTLCEMEIHQEWDFSLSQDKKKTLIHTYGQFRIALPAHFWVVEGNQRM